MTIDEGVPLATVMKHGAGAVYHRGTAEPVL